MYKRRAQLGVQMLTRARKLLNCACGLPAACDSRAKARWTELARQAKFRFGSAKIARKTAPKQEATLRPSMRCCSTRSSGQFTSKTILTRSTQPLSGGVLVAIKWIQIRGRGTACFSTLRLGKKTLDLTTRVPRDARQTGHRQAPENSDAGHSCPTAEFHVQPPMPAQLHCPSCRL